MRQFFGLNVDTEWPEKWPPGRVIGKENRHITFLFIGEHEPLHDIPAPPFKVGFAGYFDKSLVFHRDLIAWRANFGGLDLFPYYKELSDWLKLETKEFLPHATVCRKAIHIKEWKESFHPKPFISTVFHLFESLGFSKYRSLWRYDLPPPFEEMPHTADLAFRVRAESVERLLWNAWIALSFHCPDLLHYPPNSCSTLDDLIIELNRVISRADSEGGTPFKAVSFHGELKQLGPLIEWEMIVDV